MRVLLRVTRRPGGWDIEYLDAATGWAVASMRPFERCPAPHDKFPLPPAHSIGSCSPLAHLLCADATGASIRRAFEGMNQLDVPAGDIDRFGGYLFQCLLGDRWAEIEKAAGANNDIELELLLEEEDRDLQSLWWEMMFAGTEPLAAQKTRKVAVTRIVKPTVPVPQPSAFQLPLKVLFVIGRQIDNALRPGAELIGLLNRVPLPVAGSNFNRFQTAHLHVRLIHDAAWDEIESAARSFRPDVVHIVSHGELDPNGNGTRILLTDRDPEDPVHPEAPRAKTGNPYPCSAARLLDLVRVDGIAPAAMVVNACHTAEVLGQNAADLAFTAQLVRGGVPVALGMSGEVADRACQVFTLGFYQGLLRGVPVTLAAAQGRRAALLDFPEDTHAVEWARPTLFMAEGIDPAFGIIGAPSDWSAIAERYRTLITPDILCDRLDSMDRYESFRASLPPPPGKSAAIAFVAKETGGVGKTRLLEEIAARSVFDNFVPVVVRNNRENPEAPQNHLEMALQISGAIEKARENFGLPRTPLPMTREFAYLLAEITHTPEKPAMFALQETKLDDFLRQNRMSGKPKDQPLERVLRLVQDECAALQKELTKQGAPPPTVLLLLDDLHRYGPCVPELLPRIREHGLGRPGLPLPVVFTCNGIDEDKLVEEALRQRQDIFVFPLGPFEGGIIQRLACRQFVFSLWKSSVTSRRDKKDLVEAFYDSVQYYTNGRPKQFLGAEVGAVVEAHRRIKTLIPTNFEEMLGRWK